LRNEKKIDYGGFERKACNFRGFEPQWLYAKHAVSTRNIFGAGISIVAWWPIWERPGVWKIQERNSVKI